MCLSVHIFATCKKSISTLVTSVVFPIEEVRRWFNWPQVLLNMIRIVVTVVVKHWQTQANLPSKLSSSIYCLQSAAMTIGTHLIYT